MYTAATQISHHRYFLALLAELGPIVDHFDGVLDFGADLVGVMNMVLLLEAAVVGVGTTNCWGEPRMDPIGEPPS